MSADATPTGHRHCYGDFPRLFWDARPDAPIDIGSPVTLARLLTRADAGTVGKLVPPELLRERLETLPIPEHTRTFWRRVLQYVAEAAPGPAPTAR